MAEEEDVFTLPEYDCASPSEVDDIQSIISEVHNSQDGMTVEVLDISHIHPNEHEGGFITSDPEFANGTLKTKETSNYCESVTSCSSATNDFVKRIIEVNESSNEYVESEEDEEEIFFSGNYKQSIKRQREETEEEDEKDNQTDTESRSTDVVVVPKTEAKDPKETKRQACKQFSREELSLKCEWEYGEGQCTFPVTRNKYDFAEHVRKHSEDMKFTDDDRYQCQWKGCKATLDAHNCVFHIYFHAYHTALKSVGTNCDKRDKFKKCSFPTHRVNSFKTRETNRICLWNNCRESFVNMFAYELHIEHHMEKFYTKQDFNVKLPCEWNNCHPRSATNRKAMMLRHLLKHTQLKQVACPACGDMFKTRIAYKVHCHRMKKDIDLQCNLCKKFFATEALLHNHVQNHVYTKQCHFCQAMCLSASTLATHIRYKHLEGEHHFKCNVCDFRTVSNHQLNTHKQTHLPKEKRTKLICDYSECTYTCFTRRTLYDHIKSKHEGARYICHVCSSRSYQSSTALSKHLKKKHSLTFPVGTDRFRYRKDKEGNYRLQTVRYESIENEEEPPHSSPSPASIPNTKLPRYSLRLLQNNGKVEIIKEEDGDLKY